MGHGHLDFNLFPNRFQESIFHPLTRLQIPAPGGTVQKPYSSSVPSPHRLFKNSSSELEFLKSQWGLGTAEEEGYRTGPPEPVFVDVYGHLGIDSKNRFYMKN